MCPFNITLFHEKEKTVIRLKVCLTVGADRKQENIVPGESSVRVQSAIASLIPIDPPINLVRWSSLTSLKV